MATTLELQLFQYQKNEIEDQVRCTCFLMVNGEQKGTDEFILSDSALGPNWTENDLVRAINESDKAIAMGIPCVRMPPRPKPVEAPVETIDLQA